MANSRKLVKGWLFDDRYINLTIEAKAALPLLFDKTDDLGIIQSPLSTLAAYNFPQTVIGEIGKAGYIKTFNFDNRTYYYFDEWDQNLQYFQLSGLVNPLLMANLFIGATGKTVFKDHTDNHNHDFINRHKLLIQKVYKRSGDFRTLMNWLDENADILTKPMADRLRNIGNQYNKQSDKNNVPTESQ
ncbi:MAG: hypothetical protein ABF899_08445 [Oenococcus sp.]|uniref:hypothetical protein n=1 Tax=Oenococcus sp. TaxID=1979414 RepID=UPI0039EA0FE1